MNIYRIQLATALSLFISFIANGQELLQNNNWEKMKGGIPLAWRFHTYSGKSSIKLSPEIFKNKKTAVIESNKINGKGYVGQYTKVKLAAGKNIVVSGYYRTENIILDTKGMIRVNIIYNYAVKDKNFPKIQQAVTLNPSKKWKKFEAIKALNTPVKDFFAFFMLYQAFGKIYFRDLSLKVQESSSEINKKEKYIWREAENVVKYAQVTTWGKQFKDYFSGKGGIYQQGEPFKWNFRIKEEVNQETLLPEKRNYFVWVRMYGYMERPKVSVFFKGRKISSFKTKANEKVKNGKYVGPGKYYWQKAGSFSAIGGSASLKIKADGRMLLDAVLITTDSKYVPMKYEARETAGNSFFNDIRTSHTIKSIYRIYGISDKVSTPLRFAYRGKIVKIPGDQKPAVFHISIPANIKVTNVSSHWAGKDWNRPTRWGKKYLSWKKTGQEIIDEIKYNKYEIYIYYLSLTYTIFVRAEESDFHAGRKLSCKYYLKYKNKKQLLETLPLLTVALRPTKAFKTIMIGPCGGLARSLYEDYPNIAKDMVFYGLNIVNPWHIYPDKDKNWIKFRNQCIQNRITIVNEHTPFHGSFAEKDKKFQALSLDGKSSSHRQALAINEESAAFRKTLKYLSNQGKQGVTGMVFDDESFNQRKDKYDYSQLTIEKFKIYIAKLGISYVDPKVIIKNKKKYAAQYKAWVTFKCDCVVEIYSKFRQAYLKGIAEAHSSSTFGKKLFIPQILINKTPEESKINTYWDYKKLATVCDYISPMIYTYSGIKDSARVGDVIEMYNKYIGKKIITPTLMCEHNGYGQVAMPQKKMFKYQILEALMQQSRIILFWKGPSVYNPVNTQHISEAVRWAAPYEDIILNGEEYKGASSSQQWLRIKGLKLNNRILLYVANYRNSVSKKVQIKLKGKIKSVLEIGTGKQLPIKNNSFSVGFKSDRGKLFLIIQ